MHFVRATALFGALAVSIFATGCSGGGGGATPPIPDSGQQSTIDQTNGSGALQAGTSNASALSTVTAPASGWNLHVQGQIVAIKSSTEFEINGGKGVGYLNVYLTSSTVKNYNGLTPKAGEYADVYGNGSVSTSITGTQVTLSTSSTFTTSSTTSAPASGWNLHVTGPIVAIKSSTEFEINGGSGVGYLNVYLTSTTTKNYNGLSPKVGEYADIYGNGSVSTSVTATQVALSSTSSFASSTATAAPSASWNLHVKGPVVAIKSSTEFEINGGSGVGYLNVYTTSTTTKNYNGLTLKTGMYADVYGNGSVSTSVTATQVTLSTTSTTSSTGPTPAPTSAPVTSGVPKHILTADYFAGYYGTTKVTPSQAAPHLSWAQTTIADSSNIAAAGIKTQVYVDPNREQSTDPIYGYIKNTSSAWAHNCSGTVVTMQSGTTVQMVSNPASSALRSAFQDYVANAKANGHVDMIFEDNGGVLSPFAKYPNGMPCGYSDSSWITASEGLNQVSSVPIIANGLNLWTSSALSPVVGLVNGSSNTLGGNMEHCFTDNSRAIQYGTAFIQVQNTALQMLAHGKLYECMARNTNTASTQLTARIFTLASFLMTYDPNHSVLAEEFATPSGLHVFPESQLVPMNPVIAQPSSISALRTSSGVYARQYNACYYAGVNKGACVVAVNNDSVTRSFPYSGYTHTLTLSGNGILDGGTASTSGPAPSSSMAPGAAVIAFK